MVDEEAYEVLQKFAREVNREISSLKHGQKALQAKIEEGEGKLPWYLAKSPDQMEQELIKQGRLGPKEEKGLQDNFAATFRYAVRYNERGDLVEGLESKYNPNAAANFMEMCESLTLVGVGWNFTPLGYISSFKGGWNVTVNKAKDNAKITVENIKRSVPNVAKQITNTLGYYDNSKKLTELLENKKYEWKWDAVNNIYKLDPVVLPTPIPEETYHLIGNTPNGPRKRKIKIPVNEKMIVLSKFD